MSLHHLYVSTPPLYVYTTCTCLRTSTCVSHFQMSTPFYTCLLYIHMSNLYPRVYPSLRVYRSFTYLIQFRTHGEFENENNFALSWTSQSPSQVRDFLIKKQYYARKNSRRIYSLEYMLTVIIFSCTKNHNASTHLALATDTWGVLVYTQRWTHMFATCVQLDVLDHHVWISSLFTHVYLYI